MVTEFSKMKILKNGQLIVVAIKKKKMLSINN